MLLALVFLLGVVVGAATFARVAWYVMTPNFRLLVRASLNARRARSTST